MKSPIFTKKQRDNFIIPRLEISKLKFKREIEKNNLGKFLKKIVEWLVKILNNE